MTDGKLHRHVSAIRSIVTTAVPITTAIVGATMNQKTMNQKTYEEKQTVPAAEDEESNGCPTDQQRRAGVYEHTVSPAPLSPD
jgi:hypothetical protein